MTPSNTALTLRNALSLTLGLLATSCSTTSSSTRVAGGQRGPVAFPEGSTLLVTQDTSFKQGTYLRPALGEDGRQGAILLEDLDGVTVDLSGIELRGAAAGTDLALCVGWGIVVRGCTDVTLRGGRIGGYKACIVVENSSGITVEGVEFDGWYGQRLQSTVTAENGADWLWPHENDRAEWLVNYGAAISVTRGHEITISNCKGRHGQNGILLTRTEGSEVFDNDFSFLSGWGLGMFRSSENKISHNAFDYCVRGYSHDVYWRGQDAAGILMYERSSNNVVAHNSATHCGDGISIFGGNDIVGGRGLERGETEVGGSDGNLIFDNDLSFAVGTSLKVSFSAHNVATKNRLSGSHQFGVLGSYSSNLLLFGNEVHGTLGSGISIEHAQDCLIAQNSIRDNLKGIELFWDEDPQYVDGPFGEQRDTDSRGHWVLSNTLADNDLDLRLAQTTEVAFANNRFPIENRRLEILGLEAEGRPDMDEFLVREWMSGPDGSRPSGLIRESTLRPWDGRGHPRLEEVRNQRAPVVSGRKVVIAEPGEGALETIVMGEWGPWDHRSMEDRPSQRFPGGLLAQAEWDAVWFPWNPSTSDPRGDVDAWRALRSEPYLRRTVANWASPWPGNEIRKVVGNEYFGLIADTQVTLPKGGWYELTVTSDDGVRVSIDGSIVLEDWTWHSAKEQSTSIELEAGNHTIDLEYFQIYGAAALIVHLEAVEL
ncbi:MAG: nitrous oxidase accessory protein NosD [Chlamydiales bacterium]|jgi:nitrous oxidase accessory protein NosD